MSNVDFHPLRPYEINHLSMNERRRKSDTGRRLGAMIVQRSGVSRGSSNEVKFPVSTSTKFQSAPSPPVHVPS